MLAPAPKPTLLAVIPGNPGDAVFYREFAAALAEHGHEVTVASHLLLEAPPESLMPYALHHVEAITSHLAGSGRSLADVEVVLIGHSVGAYLAHLIVTRRLLPVARVFLLCPFLARPSLSGRLILWAVTSRWLAVGLRGWRLLPRWLRRWLVAAAGAGGHGEWVLAALESEQPRAWGAMAAAESREIAARADASYLFDEPMFQDPSRFAALLCRRDRWAPRRFADPRAPAALALDGVAHAFVVHPVQCRAVARLIHQRLAPVSG